MARPKREHEGMSEDRGKDEHSFRRTYPLKNKSKSRPVHRVLGVFQVDIIMPHAWTPICYMLDKKDIFYRDNYLTLLHTFMHADIKV